MDRRILIALAAVAGICAAILLFPSREKVDADVAIGHDHSPKAKEQVEQTPKKKKKKRRINDVTDEPAPNAKEASKARNDARKATPYYQHVQSVGKYWLLLANTLGPAGEEELATEMREVARKLREGSRTDGTQPMQEAALALEGELIPKVQAVSLPADKAQILDYLVEAHKAALANEPPPELPAFDIDYEPTAGEPSTP